MPIYTYTAKNNVGGTVSGDVEARNRETAVGLLKNQGFTVVSIKEKTAGFSDILSDFKNVPQGEVATFTRQLSTMVSAGLPIARALEVLSSQSTNSKLKKIISDVLKSVEGGASLSASFSLYPKVFSNTYVSLVRAGESSGKLDVILKKLADNMEADRELNSKFKSAMIYPIVILVAMMAVMLILMVFVMPKLTTMYEGMQIELPATTKIIINVSNFMAKYIYLILIVIVGLVIVIRSFFSSERGKNFVSEIIGKVPVFGKITLMKDYSSFSRTLSLLINAGVPIVDALNIVSVTMSGMPLRRAIQEAARQVEKGNSLSSFFKSNSAFPPLIGQMMGVGEETGKTDEVLERVAVYYEGEVNNLVKGLSSALEPLILVILGVMVGFLIISVITPIYKLTSAI
ncbi:MAG TPA: type II secretion system F family protein [bacterium]|jgi:type IV pilus assembly protein PilC|nr:type II secretion system F family protein [bacterium]